ncbi:hypothetical protein DNU06_00860 [Putridiphycobacter roseus]|uniref:Uncharacterized protein n=1 Tax=Putridiphycobacter roseus TaxID=2219161 RepID=A0A2W1N2A2_9FLAO|nr:hypothetical protein [Putridiphycobacter roseus]PZE18417.1 hypothetical protein DNU06_00860 [Putridiphycobacter roseus]
MKIIGIIVGLIISLSCSAQKPQKVYSITKEINEVSWYQTQSDLWEKEIKKNKKNGEAWYNYYAANRALRNISHDDSLARDKYQKLTAQIAIDVYQTIPNSFEANHIVWWDGWSDQTKLKYLKKAYEINPLDTRTYGDLMTHYAVQCNQPEFEKFALMVYQANDMPGGTYNWAYNLLAGLDENAIVFSAGDNDTFLPWVIQVAKEHRKDVTVINTSLILLDDYREKIFNQLNIAPIDLKFADVKTKAGYDALNKKIRQAIFEKHGERPIYVSGTAIQQFEDDYSDQLYLTGLAYKYALESIDNLAIIKRNVEKRYLLDGLLEQFSFHPLDKKTKQFNAFYLPAFMKLYCHYYESEELLKAEQLRKLMITIAKGTEQESEIEAWLNEKP